MRKTSVLVSSLIAVAILVGMQLFRSEKVQTTRHLLLAHGLPPDHPVHLGMVNFKDAVERRSEGRIRITIYPSAQIGNEKQVLELVQLGAISMTKVSSLSLEAFSPLISILNLPFLFKDSAHYHRALDSTVGEELLLTPIPRRMRGLTYYDAGSRSFYGHIPILTPKDMRGLKVRVMESATAIRMMQLLDGSPTPMPYGEVYTALQQGVIDGAENNITAITVNRHGEVAKHFSRVEHIFAPDILLISEPVWQTLSASDQAIVKEEAERSKVYQRELWKEKVIEYEADAARRMGVEFHVPERDLFREKVTPLHQEFEERGEDFARIIRAIKAF